MIDYLGIDAVKRHAGRYCDIEVLRHHVESEDWDYLSKWNPPTDTTSWLPSMYPEADLRCSYMFLATVRTTGSFGRFVAQVITPRAETLKALCDDDAFDPAYAFVRDRVNGCGEISLMQKFMQRERLGEDFYDSQEWKALRYRALEFYGGQCMACGRAARNRVTIHVDHIKPRSRYPELALEISNLQILCHECNLGKSADYTTDWRPNPWRTLA